MNEILLKTAISCMACDGTIADEEISVLTNSKELKQFPKSQIMEEIEELKDKGKLYIKEFIDTLSSAHISETLGLSILNIAVEMIKSDNLIEYAEIKFFKLIKNSLKYDNEFVLEHIQGIDADWVEDDLLSYEQIYNNFFRDLNLNTITDYQFDKLINQ